MKPRPDHRERAALTRGGSLADPQHLGAQADVSGNAVFTRVVVRGGLDRDKQLGVVKELTDIVADAAGDPSLTTRIWVLVTEAPEGGWGINGHANTGVDITTAARAELGAIAAAKGTAQ